MKTLKELFRPKYRHQTREAETLAKAESGLQVERRKRILRQIGIALMGFLALGSTYLIVILTVNLVSGGGCKL
jgi:hypothetical protein